MLPALASATSFAGTAPCPHVRLGLSAPLTGETSSINRIAESTVNAPFQRESEGLEGVALTSRVPRVVTLKDLPVDSYASERSMGVNSREGKQSEKCKRDS